MPSRWADTDLGRFRFRKIDVGTCLSSSNGFCNIYYFPTICLLFLQQQKKSLLKFGRMLSIAWIKSRIRSGYVNLTVVGWDICCACFNWPKCGRLRTNNCYTPVNMLRSNIDPITDEIHNISVVEQYPKQQFRFPLYLSDLRTGLYWVFYMLSILQCSAKLG